MSRAKEVLQLQDDVRVALETIAPNATLEVREQTFLGRSMIVFLAQEGDMSVRSSFTLESVLARRNGASWWIAKSLRERLDRAFLDEGGYASGPY